MDSTAIKWFFFIFLCLAFGAVTLIVKNKKRYFMFLMVFFASLPTGIIVYQFNGIMLMDFPLFILLFLELTSNKKFRFSFNNLSIPIFGIIIYNLLTVFLAVDTGLAISEWTRDFRAFLAFACIVNFVKSKKDIEIILKGFLVGFLFQSVVATLQWRFGYLGLWMLGESATLRWRSSGFFLHPVIFSTYLTFLLPLFFRLFIFSQRILIKKFIILI